MEENKKHCETIDNQGDKSFNIKFEDLYPNRIHLSDEDIKRFNELSYKKYIPLNENKAKEYCARNCKNDDERKNVEAAVHIIFNSLYGNQTDVVRYFPVEFDKYLEYVSEKIKNNKI